MDVVSVAEFLREAGCATKDLLDRVNRWTAKSSKLGLTKANHFQKQRWHGGRGTREQWAASRATMRKVWATLAK